MDTQCIRDAGTVGEDQGSGRYGIGPVWAYKTNCVCCRQKTEPGK